jgi:hypothetical protein
MAQLFENPYGGPLGARIGAGLGKGLSESIPKEVERSRLAQGLQSFAKNSANLSPLEAYAQIAALPGITPSHLQAIPELLKLQSERNANKGRGTGRSRGASDSGVPSQQISQIPQETRNVNAAQANANIGQLPRGTEPNPDVSNPEGTPGIQQFNPLDQAAAIIPPWTPERWEDEIADIQEQFPYYDRQQAAQVAAQRQAAELAQPIAVQEERERLKKIQDQVEENFENVLKEKLEKSDSSIFNDISGTNKANMKRQIARELRLNPNANQNDIVHKWTDKALEFARTKNQFKGFSSKGFLDKISDKKENLNKLKTYSKIYSDTGNSQEYFDTLKSSKDRGGLDLSPQAAASIAYPTNKEIQNYTSTIKPSKYPGKILPGRKYASDIEDKLTDNDSLLSIALGLRYKDPLFNQNEFFDQLRDDYNSGKLRLNHRQARELGEGGSGIFLNWPDFTILPFYGD